MFYIFNQSDEWEERDWSLVWVFETFLSGYFFESQELLQYSSLFESMVRTWKTWCQFIRNSSLAREIVAQLESKTMRRCFFHWQRKVFVIS